ncbi:hypothetical protein LJ707_15125 [Mucilaginibacter sp. UR6-1]|uniref:hypothetical protein n=1 Tax=Mucilaginibacter sp. UR6-1 TaxID=1435643 RepID=UPI001E5D6FB0|nr:hypothetical protein [Mucilaginibacter sp. UR6-1]MCC8410272.1 hypothetical protein [Mucilaginibacter sp. UR6-1]
MKKNILTLVIFITVSALSCKKDNTTDDVTRQDVHNVTFNITGFDQSIEPAKNSLSKKKIQAADPSLGNLDLRCLYYRSDGTFVTSDEMSKYDDDYGTFKAKLAPGNYTILFYAYSRGFSDDYVYPGALRWNNLGYEAVNDTLPDIFGKRINLTVSSSSGDISQDIILHRYFGNLAVQITDALPSNITSIEARVRDCVSMYMFSGLNNSKAIGKITASTQNLAGKAGVTNYVYNTPIRVFGTGGPLEVVLTAYGSTGILSQKVLPNVNFYTNTKTILRGKLFESNQTGNNAGFSASFETFLPDSITAEF